MDPNELKQRAKAEVEAAGAILKRAEDEKRDLTEEETGKIAGHYAESDKLMARAQRIEEQRAREAGFSEPERTPAQPASDTTQPDGQQRSRVEIVQEECFRSTGHFLQAVYQLATPANAPRGLHERMDRLQTELRAAAGMSAGSGSDGGFMVMTQMDRQIREMVFSDINIPGRCDRQPIGSEFNSFSYLGVDSASRADGYRDGGILTYWEPEAGTLTATKAKFKTNRCDLGLLTALTIATYELLRDWVGLTAWYNRKVPQAMAWNITDKIIRGTGAGIPKGILNSNAKVQISKETGQTAATIIAKNVQKMYSAAFNKTQCEWWINPDCWQQIFELHQVIGTGGVPLYVPPGGLSQAPYGTLLGRPIYEVEQCEALGTVGDIMFCNPNEYLIVEKGSIDPYSSIHVYFDTNQSAFKWLWSINGQPTNDVTIAPYKGSTTRGAFVVLATRA